jgi:hypothetical protein
MYQRPAEDGPLSDEKLRIARKAASNQAVLEVRCDSLEMSELFEFQAACVELLETGAPELLIDARAIKSITSVFLGSIIKAALQARESGQNVTLCARRDVANLFKQLVGNTMLTVVHKLPVTT